MKQRNLKAEFYKCFKMFAYNLIAANCKDKKVHKEEIELLFYDNSEGFMRVGTVVSGYPKGEFGVYSNFKLFGGLIIRIVQECKIHLSFEDNKLLFGDCAFVIKKLNFRKYEFTVDTDVDAKTKEIVTDMQKYYIPIFESFTSNFKHAVENFESKEYYRIIDRNRFTTGVVLAYLSNEEKFVDDLIKMATIPHKIQNYDRKDFFNDYHTVANPIKEIVEPIKVWFAENSVPS